MCDEITRLFLTCSSFGLFGLCMQDAMHFAHLCILHTFIFFPRFVSCQEDKAHTCGCPQGEIGEQLEKHPTKMTAAMMTQQEVWLNLVASQI